MDKDSKLILVGGIMINMDEGVPDLFIPLNFESIAQDGVVTNLMKDSFGPQANDFALSLKESSTAGIKKE